MKSFALPSFRCVVGIGLALALSAILATDLRACTLWAAVVPETGGTIISKNRDWKADHTQELKFNRKGRYAYFGLYAVGNDQPGLKQGVNEQGLCVVTATAGSIPEATREQHRSKRGGAMSTLLANYATCDQVLADAEKLFSNRSPSYLMISDRAKIITVEIGLDGRYAVKVTQTGHAAHTNHFVMPELADCNLKTGEGSETRYKRISELLENADGLLDIAAFAKMSKDRNAGNRDSLWRTGKGSVTLSSWILETPAKGDARLRVLMANPGEPEKEMHFVLNQEFWAQRG